MKISSTSPRDIDALLAPFRALGAGEMVATVASGERVVFGIQCEKTALDDSYMPLLLNMPELCALGLSKTAVTNAALPVLEQLPCLESLDLDNTIIDDAGLALLASFPRLEFLHVVDTRVTKEGIQALQKSLPRCEIVTDFNIHEIAPDFDIFQ